MRPPEWFSEYLPEEQISWNAQRSLLPLLLVVRQYNLETVSVSDSSAVDNPIAFRRSAVEGIQHSIPERRYLVAAALAAAPEEVVSERVHELSGRVREIDLDQRKLKLHETLTLRDTECEFGPDLVEDVKRSLDRDVIAMALKLGRRRFKIMNIRTK